MYSNRILPRLAVKLLVYEISIFHLLGLYIIYHMNVVAVVEKAFACLTHMLKLRAMGMDGYLMGIRTAKTCCWTETCSKTLRLSLAVKFF
jgi:hypothetical protein